MGAIGLVGSGCTSSPGATQPTVGGPPPGHYVCKAGGYKNLYSGEFDIKPGWQYVGVEDRGGQFRYEQANKKLVFTTGDFEYWDFVAVYQTAAESNDGRERLVLMYESAPEAIGQERPGEFQYCYRKDTAQDQVAVSRDMGSQSKQGVGE